MNTLAMPKMNNGRKSQLNCKPPDMDDNYTNRPISTSEKIAAHRNSQIISNSHLFNARATKTKQVNSSQGNSTQQYSRMHSITQSLMNPQQSVLQARQSVGACKVNARSVRKYGSVKAVLTENERMSKSGIFIIHPYSNFRMIWDTMTLVLLIINCLFIPVFMAFPVFELGSEFGQRDNKAFYAHAAFGVKIFSDIFFSIDIVLSFRTGIINEGSDNEVMIDPIRIRKIYLKKWFWIDLISTIPFDIFINAVSDLMSGNAAKSTSFLRYFRLTKLLQLLRLLRITRFLRSKTQFEDMINIPYDDALVLIRMFSAFLGIICYAHISACMQFMIPMIMNFPHNSWVMIRGLQNERLSIQYGWSFFRAVSQMLCIGYGVSPPNCMIDMYVVTLLMLTGAICFALYIGFTTSILQSHNASKRLYSEKYSSIKQYMLFRKLPMELRRRISDYYENRYQGKMFNERQILKELNPILREELINHNCRELVDAVPFFTEADPEFVSTIVTYLKFEVYLYGDEIIRQGTIGRKMYFISRGTVRIANSHDRDFSMASTLADGEFFGEISIVLPTKRRTCSVFADSYCYLYSLSVEDFDMVLQEFPMQRKHFMAEAAKRLENMKSDEDKNDLNIAPKMSIRKWYKKRASVMTGGRLTKMRGSLLSKKNQKL